MKKILIALILGIFLFSFASAALTDNIYSYYKLDETTGVVVDSLGVNNGTASGVTRGQTGLIENSVLFNYASNNYINLSDAGVGGISNTDYTLSAWYYPTSLTLLNPYIYSERNSARDTDLRTMGITSTSGVNFSFNCVYRDSGNVLNITQSQQYTTINTWYHVVCQKDGTTQRLWVNGVNIANGAITNNAMTTDIAMIGDDPKISGTPRHNGKIDEVGIWDRALTSSEVTQIYNGGTGITYPFQVIGLSKSSPITSFTSNQTINFTVRAYNFLDATEWTNVSLFTNETGSLSIRNSTTGLSGTEIQETWFRELDSGFYLYKFQACLTNSTCFETSEFTIRILAEPPTIDLLSPNETFNLLKQGDTLYLTGFSNSSLLDTVWFEYNGTNTTISGATTETLFNQSFTQADSSKTSLIVWANDSVGNLNSETVSWDYTIFDLNNYTYNSEVIEATSQQFIADFKLGESLSSGILSYDGTNYTTSIVSIGDSSYRFTKTINVPLVTTDENKTFFYYINGIKTQSLNQTVVNLGMDDCSAYSYLLINYTLLDEETQEIIDNANSSVEVEVILYAEESDDIIGQFNQIFTGDYNPQVCSKLNLSGQSIRLYEQSRYYSDDYVAEIHNIQNQDLSETDTPIIINLLDLAQADATEFKVTYKSAQFLAIEDALINLQRKYIGEGVYKTVEIPSTDSNGQAKINVDLSNVLYRAEVWKEGVLLAEFENLALICDNELQGDCTLDLNEKQSVEIINNIDTENDFVYRLQKDNRTISLIFSVPSGDGKTVNLFVNQSTILGNTTACNQSLYASSGQIDCEIEETLGDVFLDIQVSVNGELITTASTALLEDREQYFGTNHIILTFFLVLSLVLLMLSDAIAVLIGLVVGLISAGLMLLLNSGSAFGGTSVLLYIIITIIILIVRISKRQ